MTDTLSHFAAPLGDATFATPDTGQLARLDTHWMESSVAVVSAHGDIDSMNAHTLTEYSLANLARCRGLILDLTRLEFFGVRFLGAAQNLGELRARWNRLGVGTRCCGIRCSTSLRPGRLAASGRYRQGGTGRRRRVGVRC